MRLPHLFLAFVILAGLLGAAGGLGGIVWAAMIMGLVSAVIGDAAARKQDERIRELEAELARYKRGSAPDRAPRSEPAPPDDDAFLRGLRQLGERK
jgi:hypothetical protein